MVKVELPSNTSTRGETIEHSTGSTIKVSDGHLHVVSGSLAHGDTVAIYAPDRWMNAVIEK